MKCSICGGLIQDIYWEGEIPCSCQSRTESTQLMTTPKPQTPLMDEQKLEGLKASHATCHKHWWDALGAPCPKCTGGDAPRHCIKHGWSHMTKGCPECAAGR